MKLILQTGKPCTVRFVFLAISPVWARDPVTELVTDRPDQTESSSVVPLHLLQLETGFGLHPEAPDYFISAGVSYRIPE